MLVDYKTHFACVFLINDTLRKIFQRIAYRCMVAARFTEHQD